MKERYFEVHYEDLVGGPEPVLQELLRFIGERWDPIVLDFHRQEHDLRGESAAHQLSRPVYTSSVGRWRTDLRPSDKPAVRKIAGDLLIELGYTTDHDW